MEIRFYVDDGDVCDLRVAELLEKYGFTGIFYIAPMNPQVKLMQPTDIRKLSEKHEIGAHGLSHTVLTRINPYDRAQDVLMGRHLLEEIVGRSVHRFAYPRGWYNPEVLETIITAGFSEARTMKQGVTEVETFEGNFEIPVTVHFHPDHFQDWERLYKKAKESAVGYFGVTCHGWELEKFNLWGEYENMLKQIYADQAA